MSHKFGALKLLPLRRLFQVIKRNFFLYEIPIFTSIIMQVKTGKKVSSFQTETTYMKLVTEKCHKRKSNFLLGQWFSNEYSKKTLTQKYIQNTFYWNCILKRINGWGC